MKSTKIMCAMIATFLLTWLALGTVNYLVTEDITFRDAVTAPGIALILLTVGWVPAVIVGNDLDDYLHK